MTIRRILLCTCILLVGCESVNQPDRQEGFDNPIFSQPVENPGKLHNEIAREYASRRDGYPTRQEFVANMLEATNEVLRREGIGPPVGRHDIDRALNELLRLREDGFDFYADEPDDPVVIIDAYERRGLIDTATASALRNRLDPERFRVLSHGGDDNMLLAFDDVLQASREFWRYETEPSVFESRAMNGLSPEKRRDVIFQVDATGLIVGAVLGAGGLGSAIVSALASWAFMEMPPEEYPSWEDPGYGAA